MSGAEVQRFADTVLSGSASISGCGTYRYELRRHLGGTGILVWVMLNPSTADASMDDPTIRRVISFTKREDIGLAVVVNLFALRSPSPKTLRGHADPVGPDNDLILKHWADRGWPIVCAWGAGGGKRATEVLAGPLAEANLYCLGTTKDGSPRHPLYVKGDQPLTPFFGVPLIDGPEDGA
jgi:hypothetical protein